jgi:PEP-CTERM motif
MKKTQVTFAAFALLVSTLLTTGSARADTWSAGAFTTYDQAEWGDPATTAGNLLGGEYGTVYTSTGDLFVIGNASTGFFAEFTGGSRLDDFLPASGAVGSLNADLANPTTTSAGIFAGQVAGLKLNIDFSAAGLLPGPSGLHFGDLVLTGMTGTDAGLNGLTVSQFLSLNDMALGGADTGFTIADLEIEVAQLNNAFDDGTVASSFAQDHLVAPGSSVGVPEPPTLLLAAAGVLAAATFRKKRALGRPNPI